MPKFSFDKAGCIEARKWLMKENLLNSCGPSDCDGITFVTCANELYKQHTNSPYYHFADVKCFIKDLNNLLDEGCITKDDMDILEIKIDTMVSGFTKLIVDMEEEDCECF